MNCPYCQAPMEKGWIDQGRFSLYWVADKRKSGSFLPIHENIRLSSLFAGGRITTYHCENCKKFVIDENDLET